MRTLEWDYDKNELVMIDQRILPAELKFVSLHSDREVAEAIKDMVIRGAPAIGAAAAYGMALSAVHSKAKSRESFKLEMKDAANVLLQSRPTAVNLSWGVKRILNIVENSHDPLDTLKERILQEAHIISDEDVEINKKMATFGADLIDDGDTIIHHCNTGSLAAVDWGTALGVVRMAHEQGKQIHVLVDETRPRLQGARLTAWELQQYKIPFEIISDNAAGYFLKSGKVNKVIFGADRVAANGDVANKIGTYMLALAAYDNNVPAYSTVPTSTIDLSLPSGDQIPIEERDPDEVLGISYQGHQVAPTGARARNPAFDVTPHRLISGIITEKGVIYPPFLENIAKTLNTEE
jgi:methylthioribose-1-phosphate isomerase